MTFQTVAILLLVWVLARRQSSGGPTPPNGETGGGSPNGSSGEMTPPVWLPSKIITSDGDDITGNLSPNTRFWAPVAAEQARRFGVPPEIVLAVIEEESSGDPSAEGASGEVGLMQLTPGAVEDVLNQTAVTNLEIADGTPEDNITVGTAYLALQKTRWENRGSGSWYNALRAYQCGFQGSVDDPQCAALEANERLEIAQW